MLVYRLCRAKFSSFDGEGARLYGGRWNHPGLPIVYTAGSRSLAVLETLVHVDASLFPAADYVMIEAEVDDRAIVTLDRDSLPPAWRAMPCPDATRDVAAAHFREPDAPDAERIAALRVPSVVVPEEHNLLIDPRFPALADVLDIREPEPFTFDPRLLTH